MRPILLILPLSFVACEKVVVNYLGEDYLVTGGCPTKDPMVLKWHKFCTFLHGDSTLCVTEKFGRNFLTVPRFSNVCDALCHTSFSQSMSTCPKKKGGEGQPFSPDGFRYFVMDSIIANKFIQIRNSTFLRKSHCQLQKQWVPCAKWLSSWRSISSKVIYILILIWCLPCNVFFL